MGILFGTDGIRGIVNQYPMTAEMAIVVGRAVAVLFAGKVMSGPANVIVGKDTRESGDMLESALCAGICSLGTNACLAGVFPTPGIAFLTVSRGADAGIVISASHNPFMDNGIKIFNRHGYKLSDAQEAELEKIILSEREISSAAGHSSCGKIYRITDADTLYADFLQKTLNRNTKPLSVMFDAAKLIFDCANGATVRIVKQVFPGATIISASPDGRNINDGCGSEHPEILCRQVVNNGAAAGFAFDGDGDRVVAVDDNGQVLSGDRILAIAARYFKEQQRLENNTVVSTVMSNIGLTRSLKEENIAHVISDVGDRKVFEKMRSCGANVGGEDSGHIVFSDYQTTGDGILTALLVCRIMAQTGKSLSALASCMTAYPQEMVNVTVRDKPDLQTLAPVKMAIAAAEASLGDSGRILVRYSGTQPVCRVMAEAASSGLAKKAVEDIAAAIRLHIGLGPFKKEN